MKAVLENFRYANAWRRINRLAQIGLSLLLFAGLNIAAQFLYVRHDLTVDKRFTLAPETRAIVDSLQDPVEILVALRDDGSGTERGRLHERVRDLLDGFEAASRNLATDRLNVRYLETIRREQQMEEISQRFEIREADAILVQSGERSRLIRPADLVSYDENGTAVFRGERAVTEALLDVTGDQRKKVYFVQGHGEMLLDDVSRSRGLSQMADDLRLRGLELASIDLGTVETIPEDADLLAIVSPQVPFLPQETSLLRNYLSDDAGRVLLLVDPLIDHGLDTLLSAWGIRADDMVVLEIEESLQGAGDFFLIRRFSDHAATQYLQNNSVSVKAQLARPLRPDPTRPEDPRLQVEGIMSSSTVSWAERGYRQGAFQFDEGLDLAGPVTIAAAAERSVASQLGIDLPSGRLVALGSGGLFANENLSSLGNRILLYRTFDWLLEQENFMSIPAQRFERIEFALSRPQLVQLALLLQIIPGALALFGLTVFAIRKL